MCLCDANNSLKQSQNVILCIFAHAALLPMDDFEPKLGG